MYIMVCFDSCVENNDKMTDNWNKCIYFCFSVFG